MSFFARLDTLYLRWALRKMDPLHPDLPLIVQRLNVQRPL
jgi:hypothetical protein